jgi:hypothetical protein
MFLGASQAVGRIEKSDERHASMNRLEIGSLTHRDGSMRTEWWPRGNYLLGSQGTDYGLMDSVWWDQPEIVGGTTSRYGITGVTRDAYGSPVGGVTVKLFLTSDDTRVDQAVSDPVGTFLVSSPYLTGHYLVAYKTGTPDVEGTTVNTLVPA